MHKNKEKQRATERERQRRYRKGVTVGEGIVRKVRAREITRRDISEGTGITELRFSKSKQAKGRLSEGV